MSVDISISNSTQKNCNHIIENLLKAGIEARVIDTKSIFENKAENGCLITVGKEYNDQKKLSKLWNVISKDYICSHLKIHGLFDGCIYDYLAKDNNLIRKALDSEKTKCPHAKQHDLFSLL